MCQVVAARGTCLFVALLQKGSCAALLTSCLGLNCLSLAGAFHRGFVFPVGRKEVKPVSLGSCKVIVAD